MINKNKITAVATAFLVFTSLSAKAFAHTPEQLREVADAMQDLRLVLKSKIFDLQEGEHKRDGAHEEDYEANIDHLAAFSECVKVIQDSLAQRRSLQVEDLKDALDMVRMRAFEDLLYRRFFRDDVPIYLDTIKEVLQEQIDLQSDLRPEGKRSQPPLSISRIGDRLSQLNRPGQSVLDSRRPDCDDSKSDPDRVQDQESKLQDDLKRAYLERIQKKFADRRNQRLQRIKAGWDRIDNRPNSIPSSRSGRSDLGSGLRPDLRPARPDSRQTSRPETKPETKYDQVVQKEREESWYMKDPFFNPDAEVSEPSDEEEPPLRSRIPDRERFASRYLERSRLYSREDRTRDRDRDYDYYRNDVRKREIRPNEIRPYEFRRNEIRRNEIRKDEIRRLGDRISDRQPLRGTSQDIDRQVDARPTDHRSDHRNNHQDDHRHNDHDYHHDHNQHHDPLDLDRKEEGTVITGARSIRPTSLRLNTRGPRLLDDYDYDDEEFEIRHTFDRRDKLRDRNRDRDRDRFPYRGTSSR